MLRFFVVLLCVILSGCALLPEMSYRPQLHNPFPQLSKVAVAPFFNLTSEPTLDGRRVALAYFNELQSVPGFEVVPVGVVETAMREHQIELRGSTDARRLAQLLKVDALVVGAVTDYSPYYPPRMALQVEWYAANPGFYPVPPGYGLPWGTREEKDIPGPLVFEAEMALAKAQLKTQTPQQPTTPLTGSPNDQGKKSGNNISLSKTKGSSSSEGVKSVFGIEDVNRSGKVELAQHIAPLDTVATNGKTPAVHTIENGLPPDWPDPQGFIPPSPRKTPPESVPSNAPVLRHTKTYNGHDMDFTTALSSYFYFRDDARSGGWQSYLNRSDDFIRFCCHMHVSELLTARGGAGESRVVLRRSNIR